MFRRKLILFAQVAAVGLVALYFLLYFGSATRPLTRVQGGLDLLEISPNATLTRHNLTTYVQAITNPTTNTNLSKLECPAFDPSRYNYLQRNPLATSQQPVHYFFALNLRNCLPLLPQLLGSILEAIRFLGPTSCALSIVEGNSPDGTAEVLAALEPELTKLGIRTYFTLNHALDPLGEGNNRFKSLASLRSMALDPLVATNPTLHTADDATVVFLNDVALCPDDILELAHQRRHQAADMACAMDWSGADPPLFYDVYVSRAINGDLFFDIPLPEGSWAHAADLFWNEPIARERLEKVEPFQVFSCWNGAVAFTAQPVVEGKVAFRSSRGDRGECHHGEPQVFCKDMWFAGYGKIMVVPSVNLEYAIDKGRVIKEVKGFTSSWVAREGSGMEAKIEWLPPPDQVKCMPTFQDQSWRPWNETLV